eukprot:CAMPEP_0197175590 /NCGR_PEP_ID=MMETSP1423-20130617/1767_1 /TAXON_ID=476441 /ORGANISM="Pseudo-nitzschia heimii, Strain UNC1101" /LENGTH=629 /DNA_ID=CAMNT_0042624779 /DNA_START=259 /DNA_END=2148 /DNA_ORIENTATION=-
MMKNFLFAFCLFLAASTRTSLFASAAEGGGKCAGKAPPYTCANVQDCPDSGFSVVSDCLECTDNLNTDERTKTCFTRKLMSPGGNPTNYLWRDIVGMIVWFCAAGVATACGVGGGGIYVPLGIVLIGFAPKPASGLSQCSIFGASLGGLLLNLRNKHPFTAKIEKTGAVAGGSGSSNATERAVGDIPTNDDGEPDTATVIYYTRPLIDYDMALFLAPMEMAGAVLGVVIQTILPNWLYLFIAAVILGFTAKKTYVKWWTTRAKEMAKKASDASPQETVALAQKEEASSPSSDNENPASKITTTAEVGTVPAPTPSTEGADEIEVKADIPNGGVVGEESDQAGGDDDEVVMDAEKMAQRLAFLERDSRQYPVEKLVSFAILWIGLTILTFMKGGKGVGSLVGIDCTSPWYYVLIGCQFLWTFGFATYYALKLMRERSGKAACAFPYHAEDVQWDFAKTRFYAFFTFVAGIVAGLIGIGGGMVLGPLMLVMGINPRVSTATTATMIVLTSSSVAILYVTSGLVPIPYALNYFFTCLIGALIGKTKIDAYVKKTGKASILIFLLATIIAIATLFSVGIALLRLNENQWCFPGLKQFCSVTTDVKEVVCAQTEQERMLGSAFYGDVVRGIGSY